jgi:uncharacterized protein YpiB (UPF0302 family)
LIDSSFFCSETSCKEGSLKSVKKPYFYRKIIINKAMHTIQLNIQDSVYANFMKFVGTFKNHEIEVLSEQNIDKKSPKFLKVQKELQDTLGRIERGESKLLTQAEFEESLNKII